MFIACNHSISAIWYKFSRLLLIIFWYSGLLLGLCAADSAANVFIPLMRRVAFVPVSIVSALLRSLFFLLISVIAVYSSKLWLFLPAAFIRAFCLSFFLRGLILAWQNDAWLVAFFHATSFLLAGIPLMFWFCHIPATGQSVKRDLRIWFLVCFFAGIVDHIIPSLLGGFSF